MSIPREFTPIAFAIVDTAGKPQLRATNAQGNAIFMSLEDNMIDLLESEIVKLRKSKSVNAS